MIIKYQLYMLCCIIYSCSLFILYKLISTSFKHFFFFLIFIWPHHSIQNLSSQTRDQIHIHCSESAVLTTEQPGKSNSLLHLAPPPTPLPTRNHQFVLCICESESFRLACFIFQIPHLSDNIQYLFSSFISLFHFFRFHI